MREISWLMGCLALWDMGLVATTAAGGRVSTSLHSVRMLLSLIGFWGLGQSGLRTTQPWLMLAVTAARRALLAFAAVLAWQEAPMQLEVVGIAVGVDALLPGVLDMPLPAATAYILGGLASDVLAAYFTRQPGQGSVGSTAATSVLLALLGLAIAHGAQSASRRQQVELRIAGEERDATEALLAMSFDGSLWLSHDLTVVRVDKRALGVVGEVSTGQPFAALVDGNFDRQEEAIHALGRAASVHERCAGLGPVSMALRCTNGRSVSIEATIVACAGFGPYGSGTPVFLVAIRLPKTGALPNGSAAVPSAHRPPPAAAPERLPPALPAGLALDPEHGNSNAEVMGLPLLSSGSPTSAFPPQAQESRLNQTGWDMDDGTTMCSSPSNSCSDDASSEIESAMGDFPSLTVQEVALPEIELELTRRVPDLRTRETVGAALALLQAPWCGGALVVVAGKAALQDVFAPPRGRRGPRTGPSLVASDGGYMTVAMRGLHVSNPAFGALFHAYAQRSETDRWPEDHPDPLAKGQPKDGATVLSSTGHIIKGAAKILGLPVPWRWDGVGTKHEAALACAWAVEGSVALVRSERGTIIILFRSGEAIHAYQIAS